MNRKALFLSAFAVLLAIFSSKAVRADVITVSIVANTDGERKFLEDNLISGASVSFDTLTGKVTGRAVTAGGTTYASYNELTRAIRSYTGNVVNFRRIFDEKTAWKEADIGEVFHGYRVVKAGEEVQESNGLLGGVLEFLGKIVSILSNIVSGIVTGVKISIEWLGSVISGLFDGITKILLGFFKPIEEGFANLFKGIYNLFVPEDGAIEGRIKRFMKRNNLLKEANWYDSGELGSKSKFGIFALPSKLNYSLYGVLDIMGYVFVAIYGLNWLRRLSDANTSNT